MLECYRFNATTYESAKSYLKAAFEHIIADGGDVRQLTQFAFERFGGMFVPYLCQFLCDVHEGRIRVDGLTESTNMTILGQPVSAGAREAMIREFAYLRAEQRGFANCTPEDDWLFAERVIDEHLARDSGRVVQRQTLAAAIAGARQELGLMKDIISRWLGDQRGVTGTPERGKIPAQRAARGKESPVPVTAQPARSAQPVKKATGSRRKARTAAGPGTGDGKTPGRKSGAGKKAASRPSMPVGKREAPRKKTVAKNKPVEARKGRRVAGRKKAFVR
jgi:hypothetical protein